MHSYNVLFQKQASWASIFRPPPDYEQTIIHTIYHILVNIIVTCFDSSLSLIINLSC